jgi:hypothetical protein
MDSIKAPTLTWIKISDNHYRAHDHHHHDYMVMGHGDNPEYPWLAIPSDPARGWRAERSLEAAMRLCQAWSDAIDVADDLYLNGQPELAERMWDAGKWEGEGR